MIAGQITLTHFAPWLLLAANNRRTSQIGQRVDNVGMSIGFGHLAIGALVVAVVVAIAWFVYRWRRRQVTLPCNNPRRLYSDLCRTHNLSKGERDLLRDIATWHQLENPTQLFVEPDRFDSPEMRTEIDQPQSIARLKAMLFA